MYDIIVIGSGVSSLFLLYSLKNSNLKILVLEKGNELKKRNCPKDLTIDCKCETCNRHYGLGGPLKHEGKFNYTNDFGGELGNKIGNKLSLELQNNVDDILISYAKNKIDLYSTANKHLKERAQKANLDILTTKVRHLGVNNTYQIFSDLYDDIKDNVEFRFNYIVEDIIKEEEIFKVNNELYSQQVIVATNNFKAKELCPSMNLKQGKVRLDLGFRIEMLTSQWQNILEETIETKLKYNDSYTYCMNPNGNIIPKIQKGYVFADGQNQNENSSSNNLNFTLFTQHIFKNQSSADVYLKELMNKLNNKITVQRLEDLKNNRCTLSLKNNSIIPTIDVELKNLHNIVPNTKTLLDFLNQLEVFLDQSIDDDTLIYAIDAKFYAPTIETDNTFQTTIKNFYLIGDCSGITSSLSQAAASGLYLGNILK